MPSSGSIRVASRALRRNAAAMLRSPLGAQDADGQGLRRLAMARGAVPVRVWRSGRRRGHARRRRAAARRGRWRPHNREVLCGVVLLVAERPRWPQEGVGDWFGRRVGELGGGACRVRRPNSVVTARGCRGEADPGACHRGEPISSRHGWLTCGSLRSCRPTPDRRLCRGGVVWRSPASLAATRGSSAEPVAAPPCGSCPMSTTRIAQRQAR
jgi:hypothetical protein